MEYGITREEALNLLKENIVNPNLLKHCLATEAVMKSLAKHFDEDVALWGLAGLLHDLDVEKTPDLSVHTKLAAQILEERAVHPSIIEAVRMHNEQAWDKKRSEKFHHALAAAETITGLIIATALVYPDKNLKSVKVKSVRKRFKDKHFAAGANREIILECEKVGLKLAAFCEMALSAMQDIADELQKS